MGRAKKSAEVMRETESAPAITEEGREKQLVSLAYDLVEKRLREGTATSQETVAILKLGTSRAKLEERLVEQQVELAKAKTEALEASKRSDELFSKAIDAMRSYSGATSNEEEDYNGEDI